MLRALLVPILVALAVPAFAQDDVSDRITSFESQVTVAPDSSIEVTETLAFSVVGAMIEHGIERDIPTMETEWGLRRTLGFELISVRRDGAPEAVTQDSYDRGVRLRIGSADATVEAGAHTWEIRYRLTGVLHARDALDELNWDVTGNEWAFPIERARFVLRLPGPVAEEALPVEAWTGDGGASGADFTVSRGGEAPVEVVSTRRFEPGEGLTVRVRWPAGLVARPGEREALDRVLTDNQGELLLVGALLLALLVHLLVWWRVGRDPVGRELPARQEPPEGLSPGAVRYLTQMGFDESCFTAALLGLASKGLVRIEEGAGDFRLVRTEREARGTLGRDERTLLRKLFSRGNSVEVSREGRAVLQAALEALEGDLKLAHAGRHFRSNGKYLVPGTLVAVAAYVAALIVGWGGGLAAVGIFLLVWLSGWTVGGGFLLLSAWSGWKAVVGGRWSESPKALVSSIMAVPFAGAEVVVLGMLGSEVSPVAAAYLALTIAMTVTFLFLLRQRSPEGRWLLDEIEAYGRFLREGSTSAAQDANARHLAYAVALGLGDRFAERLEIAAGEAFVPDWYEGVDRSRRFRVTSFANEFASGLATATATSSQSSGGFSSSSSGGFSGGGSGGGGGRGW